jgi:hypothetical protein
LTATTPGPVAPKSSAAATFLARARDIYRQVPAIHTGAIQRIHSLLRFFLRAHGDEAESARATRGAVGHQIGFEHSAVGGKSILQIIFSRVKREVSNKQFVIHSVMCLYISFRVFPGIGLGIITELSSTEDLPRFESDELSINVQASALAPGLASPIIELWPPYETLLFRRNAGQN